MSELIGEFWSLLHDGDCFVDLPQSKFLITEALPGCKGHHTVTKHTPKMFEY